MYKRRKKELHSVRTEVKFTPGQMNIIEQARHVHSLKTGDYMSISQLVRAGAMRKALTLVCDKAIEAGQQMQRDRRSGQMTLLDMVGAPAGHTKDEGVGKVSRPGSFWRPPSSPSTLNMPQLPSSSLKDRPL